MKPLAIDLFCGLGGWAEGLIPEGYRVIGFDIERHIYGEQRYPGSLVIQNVLTLHGSQFRDAALIVASPPCQEYSYMAMPWKKAKAKAKAIRDDKTGTELERLNRLFNACFRIQREACEAAGRHIPMVVENVRGANPWVGRSRWNFGSFHLWGDVPALMPQTFKGHKIPSFRFDGSGRSFQTASVQETGVKAPGMNWSDRTKRGQDFTRIAGKHAIGNKPLVCDCENPEPASGVALVSEECPIHNLYPRNPPDGIKVASSSGRSPAPGLGARFTSRDCGVEAVADVRKAASAMIAKIPLPLSRHIARTFING